MGDGDIVQRCKMILNDDELSWDYFEEEGRSSPDLLETAPGTIVLLLKEFLPDERKRRSIALFAAYAARCSLECWFAYCDDDKPMKVIENVIEQLLTVDDPSSWFVDEEDLVVCEPMEDGMPITDCRAQDTLSASEAVSHAARHFAGGRINDAALSLSSSLMAFNVSPVESVHTFTAWLLDIALPAALEWKDLSPEIASCVPKKVRNGWRPSSGR